MASVAGRHPRQDIAYERMALDLPGRRERELRRTLQPLGQLVGRHAVAEEGDHAFRASATRPRAASGRGSCARRVAHRAPRRSRRAGPGDACRGISSISRGKNFLPPRLIISLSRPTIRTLPAASSIPEVARAEPAVGGEQLGVGGRVLVIAEMHGGPVPRGSRLPRPGHVRPSPSTMRSPIFRRAPPIPPPLGVVVEPREGVEARLQHPVQLEEMTGAAPLARIVSTGAGAPPASQQTQAGRRGDRDRPAAGSR